VAALRARSFSIRDTRSAFIKPARTWTTGPDPGTSSPQTSPWANRSSRYSRRSCCTCWTRVWPRQPCAGHRDNLWALGGELIRCRYDDDELAKKHVNDALRQLTRDEGGPLMWPRITESEQDSLNITCRKLNRFFGGSAAAAPPD